MSVTGSIRNLLQQQDKALYQVKEKIKEQGEKAVTNVKKNLPTPSEIKDKYKAEASATLCNAKGLDKSVKAYEKLKRQLDQGTKVINGADKALKKIKAMCDKIMSVVNKILKILEKIVGLIGKLSKVISTAKIILTGIGSVIIPPTAGVLIPAGTAIFLKDKLDIAKGFVEIIKASAATYPKLLKTYVSKALKYIGYITKATTALAAIKNAIKFIVGLLETLFLGTLSRCGAFKANNDATDNAGNISLDGNGNVVQSKSAQEFLDSIGYNMEIIELGKDPFDFSDDLSNYYEEQLNLLTVQGNLELIEKIYDANFQMLGYRRYRA